MKSEHRIQQEIIMWFNNEYPEYRGLLCYNNNNAENSWRGAQNKSFGIVPGRSDLVFYYIGVAYMIELKNDVGTQSQAQAKWEETIKLEGFPYYIIRSLKEFKELIVSIIT